MKDNFILPCYLVVLIAMTSIGLKSVDTSKTNVLVVSGGDSSLFSANSDAGWNVLSSYLQQDTPDSVEFELILTQATATNWRANNLIGIITDSSFFPKKSQMLTYDLLPENRWYIKINTDGECFLSQVRGGPLLKSSMAGAPFILPIKVRYENK